MRLKVPFLPKRSSPAPAAAAPLASSSSSSSSSSNTMKSHADSFKSSFCCNCAPSSEPNSRQRKPPGGAAVNSTQSPAWKTLLPVQIRELEAAFEFFDANSDGKISVSELGIALRRLGDNPTEEEVLQMLRDADTDGDGFIDREEFITLHSSGTHDREQFRRELKDAFRVFDADNNGFISLEELHGVFTRLGRQRSMEECRLMITRVDQDGDGHVSFEEFETLMA